MWLKTISLSNVDNEIQKKKINVYVYGRIRTCEAFYAVVLKTTPFDRSGTYTFYKYEYSLSWLKKRERYIYIYNSEKK